MNRVSKRAAALYVLVLALIGGLCFFLFEYVTRADTWIISPGSPHVYNSGNIGCGVITDRDSKILLDLTETRIYAADPLIRKSTLHWLGDRQGSISAPAVTNYAKEMTGFDMVNGLYQYGVSDGRVKLTLSADVQAAALKAIGDRKGTIGVYNYKTGEILCAITTPTFDPDYVPDIEGDTTGTYEGIYLNRFVQSAYVPGSIFKIVTTAAALETVPDIQQLTFTCTGTYEYGIDKVTCERAHGVLDLKGSLASSCNCCFAQIVGLIGRDDLQKYAEQFRITAPLTFDGVTTASGNFDVTKAAPVEAAWAGIGQFTDLVNPCRYMTFMGAIAGDGVAANPYLVAEVKAGNQTTYRAETNFGERIMSKTLAKTLQEYMRNNVQNVYGDSNFSGLTVCAKSGTSQLGGDQISNAMFSGFVADEDYPLAFIVVVENGGYGSATCVPILSQVLEACKRSLDAA